MADRKLEEAVRRAQGLSSVSGIGGRRRRISDDNPLMQGNLDPVDEPSEAVGSEPSVREEPERIPDADGDSGPRDAAPRSSRPVSAPVGGRASRPVMRPQGARDVVSQSLSGGRSTGIVSDLGVLEARRAAKRNRSRGVSVTSSGDSRSSGSPSDASDSKVSDAHDVTPSPVSEGSPSSDDATASVLPDGSSGEGVGVVSASEGSADSAGIEAAQATSDVEETSSDAADAVDAPSDGVVETPAPSPSRSGRGKSRARASSGRKESKASDESKATKGPTSRVRASGKGRGKAGSSTKRGKPVKNVVQIRDFSRDLYEVVSEMFPSGFSQTRVMNGFVAMHTGRLDCIESDTELVAAVREIMNGDAGMVGIMDEVLALREDMEAVRKSLTKTRRYALMGALGSGATLDAMAKTHGSEQGLSAEELAALSDDVTRTMDVLDFSARDFESEEFGRGRQIRGGRR